MLLSAATLMALGLVMSMAVVIIPIAKADVTKAGIATGVTGTMSSSGTSGNTTQGTQQGKNLSPLLPGKLAGNINTVPGGGVILRDCSYGGVSYSKGAVIQQADGHNYECSGDDDGTWVKK